MIFLAKIFKNISLGIPLIEKLTNVIDKNTKSTERNSKAYEKMVQVAELSDKRRLSYQEKNQLKMELQNQKHLQKMLEQEKSYQNKLLLQEQKTQDKLKLMRAKAQMSNSSGGLFGGMTLSNLFAGYYLLTRIGSALSSITDISDTAMATKARIGLYNQSRYSNDELYDMMYGVSQRSRTSLEDTGDLVNRILVSGALTGPGSATESIRLSEIINKAVVAGGGTRDENARALRQLAQGLSSGALQGDELRSIREQTPFLAEMLAQGLSKVAPELGTNLAIGDLKDLGGQGELTSERILKAFTAMEDEINKKFNQMPRTFEQSMIQINNIWTKFIENLSKNGGALQKITQIASELADYLMSERGQKMLSRLTISVNNLADGLYEIYKFSSPIFATLLESTPVIETLIGGILTLMSLNIASKVGNLVLGLSSANKTGLAVAGTMIAIAGASAIASQAFQAFGMEAEEANRNVKAMWSSLGEAIMLTLNQVFWSAVRECALVIDTQLAMVEFGIRGLKILWDSATAVLQGVGWLGAKVVDALTMNKWDLSGKAENALGQTTSRIKDNFQQNLNPLENTLGKDKSWHGMATTKADEGFDYWSNKVTTKYDASLKAQEDAEKRLAKIEKAINDYDPEKFSYKVGEVDKVKGTVDISSEDLKLLKDIALRDLLLSMTTLAPQTNITFGDVHETADVNAIVNTIADMLENAYATSLTAY